MTSFDFDALPPHEQSLLKLISSVNGTCEMDAMGIEKACSIRFGTATYPKIKAIADLSGNSLNIIVNELVQVAIGTLISNMNEEEVKTLIDASKVIEQEMYAKAQGGK